ncbi:3'-5' exonuclease [Candidatus Wolfebacteria bacterium CG03_land_8_20_14_0_80_36_15]|uniref:3'-5' exonuclease n=1 Tax=Candidatus Wolfebacteria bacterium CG03_land_8_20_14_0_80_36_15 TaxID=1975067 RepID=A0A2M7B7R8_9BACT|nr:MAG: 3'-5' exonuclease [Candidatus Wolfebacteria bacterium CG03_land_8_20_14_0_80_36_15]
MSNVSKIVFDIETVGVGFETLDKISQEYLLQYAESDEEEQETKERLGFYPLTGEIVAIGILNPDTDKGAIYLRTNNQQLKTKNLEEGVTIETGTEKEILEKFWQTTKSYNYFISFNGRGFDVPFLMIRSAILGVKPAKNLMSNRYLSSQKFDAIHVDLLDQLTFYGAFRKRFNLHFWTKAFGIKSPKEEGITGEDIKKLYQEGKFLEIVKYNYGDLVATKELYKKWNEYLNL